MSQPPGEAGEPPGPVAAALARFGQRLPKTYRVLRDVVEVTLRDGYIHAGNIAYLSLVTLLPLVILITAVAVAMGQTEAGQAAIDGMLRALPADVAQLFAPVIDEVLEARTGNLLLFGGIVALWTISTFLETLRDILHRAFRVPNTHSFVEARLRSIAGTLVAMLLILIAFLSQVVLVVALKSLPVIRRLEADIPFLLDWSRILSSAVVVLALWARFKLLSPRERRHNPAWPGAAVTTTAWVGGSFLLGPAFASFGKMSLTYGTLSGVMIALLFFYAVGFALVLGAELNAALARVNGVEPVSQPG
ncbi:MAG: YihY/virulence factor BrkB family protein [Sandaracinobacter sp.]